MRIGAALLLIAVGAILRFAVQTVSTHGFNVHTVGDILMLVGVLGLLLWALIWSRWAPRNRTTVPPRDAEVYRRETVYRDDPYRRDVVDGDYQTLPLDERDPRYR
jgi:hypothetical protein